MGLLIEYKCEAFWQEVSVKSLIIRWPLRPVGLLFLKFTTFPYLTLYVNYVSIYISTLKYKLLQLHGSSQTYPKMTALNVCKWILQLTFYIYYFYIYYSFFSLYTNLDVINRACVLTLLCFLWPVHVHISIRLSIRKCTFFSNLFIDKCIAIISFLGFNLQSKLLAN